MEALILFGLVLGLLFLGVPVGLSLVCPQSGLLHCSVMICRQCGDQFVWGRAALYPVGDSILYLSLGLHVHRRRGETFDSVCHRSGRALPWWHGDVFGAGLYVACRAVRVKPRQVVAIGTVAIAAMRQLGYSKISQQASSLTPVP